MFSSLQAHSHDAVELECEKADQRMRTDAIRQSVLVGYDFDAGLQIAEIALDIGQRLVACDGFGRGEIRIVGQQRQLSVEGFGARDCQFIKAPATTVSLQVRLDEPAQFRFGDGRGEPVIGPRSEGHRPRAVCTLF